MGTADSANDEWVELYNTGSTVDIDGWVLTDNMGLEIPLAGRVAAGQYAVLERTDDDSAPGTAFLIYTGSLSNEGRTLTLKRVDGSVEDQVAGGENWEEIGGDNVTKETAQYTSGGWVTGAATPGTKNVSESVAKTTVADAEEDDNDDDDRGENVFISLQVPDNELVLKILAPKTGYVHQPVNFSVEADGVGETIKDSLEYQWNFGDLSTGDGEETKAFYNAPGTYVVVVEGVYGRYESRARHEVTILPADISLSVDESGDVLVHNDSKYEVDVSGYVVKGQAQVTFPELSFMAPKATLVIPAESLPVRGEQLLAVYDRAGEVVSMLLPSGWKQPVLPEVTEAPTMASAVLGPKVSVTSVPTPVGQILATSTTKEQAVAVKEMVSTSSNVAAASTAIPKEKLPYLGLMGLILIGIVAVYVKEPKLKKEVNGFGFD